MIIINRSSTRSQQLFFPCIVFCRLLNPFTQDRHQRHMLDAFLKAINLIAMSFIGSEKKIYI